MPERPGAKRGERGGELPRELYLEVTNWCNLRCRTCPQYFGMPEPFAHLSLEQARHIVDQLPRIDRAVLHGIGEPFLNPALPDIVGLLKSRDAYVLFNSNGTVLSRRLVEPVVLAGLDEMRISLDAATASTYETVRGRTMFDRIIANIRRCTALKRELGRENPRLSLWMTGLQANVPELPGLIRLAAELEVGEVYLQRLVISERGLATRETSLVTGEPATDALAEAEREAARLGVTLRSSGGMSGAAPAGTVADSPESPWRGCRRPWSLTYVTVHGAVLPCCIAPFTEVPYQSIVLGNVRSAPLAEVWDGPSYRGWRSAMLDGEPPEACRRCGTDWSL